MAFTFNGTTPTAINYNGTDITVLKYSKGGTTTAVWGKPFSLSITQGANTTVTVSRTSSPNQHASTGALSSGAVVYYGDILTISASANSGYNLSAFTVNGTAWTSGNTITVTSAITVVTTAQSAASWKTVWTGSQSVASFMWKTTASGTKTTTLANGTPTGVDWSLPTKISGTASCSNNGFANTTTATITDLELSDGVSNLLHSKSGYVGSYLVGVSVSIQRNASTPNAVVTGSCSKSGASVIANASLTLTEVKQYY